MKTQYIQITTIPILLLLLLGMINMSEQQAYGKSVDVNTEIEWRIHDCPDVPFAWGWQGEGFWIAEKESILSFSIESVEPEIAGLLIIGNFTIRANNSQIAMELVLGVWGLTEFFPGLIIETQSDKIDEMKQKANDSASRQAGNYMNGTMDISYRTLNISNNQYQCIVFDYEQDATGFGEPQRTELAYDLSTGILMWANTSYSFGTPYALILEFHGASTMIDFLPLFLIVGISSVVVIIIALVTVHGKKS